MADPSGDMLFLNASTGEIIQAEENPDPDVWYRIVQNTSQASAAFEDGEYPLIASMDEINSGTLTPEDWEQRRYEAYDVPGKLWQHAPDGQANWYLSPRDGLYRAPAMRDPENDWTVVPFDETEESEEDANQRRGRAKERLQAGRPIEVPLELYERLAPGAEWEIEPHRVEQYEQPWHVAEPEPPPRLSQGSLAPEAPPIAAATPTGPSLTPQRSLAAAAPMPSPSPGPSQVPPGSGLRPIAPEVAARLQALLAQRRGPSATPAGPSVLPTETLSAV